MFPDTEKCKKLRKDAGFVDLYMGPTSLEEAQRMRAASYSTIALDLVQARVAILGGIPRYLFKPLMVIPATQTEAATTRDQVLASRQRTQKEAVEDAATNPRRIFVVSLPSLPKSGRCSSC
jgi:hypothetical protein